MSVLFEMILTFDLFGRACCICVQGLENIRCRGHPVYG